jgi:hypothetical protein
MLMELSRARNKPTSAPYDLTSGRNCENVTGQRYVPVDRNSFKRLIALEYCATLLDSVW